MGDESRAVSAEGDQRFSGVSQFDVACVGGAEVATGKGDVVAGKGIRFCDVTPATGDGLHHQSWRAVTTGLERALVRDSDSTRIRDLTSTCTKATEGTESLGRCTTTTTDGLGEECGCIDAGRGDVSGIGNANGAAAGATDQ